MLRVYRNANKEYINKLLTEMEEDRDNTYEINISEHRENTEILSLTISARQIESCNF